MTKSRMEVFKEMLAVDPSNTSVQFGLANEYLKAEMWHEAVEALKIYIENADDEGAAYGMLARAYEKIGEDERAKETYERGAQVALAHNHPSMAEEYRQILSDWA